MPDETEERRLWLESLSVGDEVYVDHPSGRPAKGVYALVKPIGYYDTGKPSPMDYDGEFWVMLEELEFPVGRYVYPVVDKSQDPHAS